jgi:hypothetical protein
MHLNRAFYHKSPIERMYRSSQASVTLTLQLGQMKYSPAIFHIMADMNRRSEQIILSGMSNKSLTQLDDISGEAEAYSM